MPRTHRRPYPSDLSDAEWALLEPLLASPERRGRSPKWPTLRVADAVFYLLRSGCAWRMLPREYPPWQTVYYHFRRRWRLDGRLRRAHDTLRAKVRAREGRARDPSAAAIDSQVVTTGRAGGPERGYDGAKRLAGRKRHLLLVDTNGLVLAVRVHGADLPDRDGGRRLLAGGLGRELPRMELVWADGAYTGWFGEWAEEELGWRVEMPYHRDRQLWRYGLEEKPRGFRVLPRRWVVERTFAWLSQVRRLSKDYERLPETGEAMIYDAMSRIMLRAGWRERREEPHVDAPDLPFAKLFLKEVFSEAGIYPPAYWGVHRANLSSFLLSQTVNPMLDVMGTNRCAELYVLGTVVYGPID